MLSPVSSHIRCYLSRPSPAPTFFAPAETNARYVTHLFATNCQTKKSFSAVKYNCKADVTGNTNTEVRLMWMQLVHRIHTARSTAQHCAALLYQWQHSHREQRRAASRIKFETRHTASTSMYSLTFRDGVMLPQ